MKKSETWAVSAQGVLRAEGLRHFGDRQAGNHFILECFWNQQLWTVKHHNPLFFLFGGWCGVFSRPCRISSSRCCFLCSWASHRTFLLRCVRFSPFVVPMELSFNLKTPVTWSVRHSIAVIHSVGNDY